MTKKGMAYEKLSNCVSQSKPILLLYADISTYSIAMMHVYSPTLIQLFCRKNQDITWHPASLEEAPPHWALRTAVFQSRGRVRDRDRRG